MNGDRFLLDTNAVIALLKGNDFINQYIRPADWIGISVISYLEFHAFRFLSDQDEILFNNFVEHIDIIGINSNNSYLLKLIIQIRKKFNLKIADAIIAATAIQHGSILITADQDFLKVENLKVFYKF
jgi:hypothetical protein